MKVYFDFRDWWIGYYRGDRHHYICLLPTVVIRWNRRVKPKTYLGIDPGAFTGITVVEDNSLPPNGAYFVTPSDINADIVVDALHKVNFGPRVSDYLMFVSPETKKLIQDLDKYKWTYPS